jgi:hypothetical protein
MTEREALKLALEALEEAWYHVGTFQPTEKAIDLYDEARTAIKEALAQPEQKPVAWMFQHEETGRMMFVETQQLEWGFEKGNPRLKKIRPVYTTPPQRKPLTYEEIILIVAECAASHQHTDIHFARAIERAHGIKELV